MARKPSGGERRLDYRDESQLSLAQALLDGAELRKQSLCEGLYSDMSEGSFHKTFKRDRDALADQGIYVVERRDGTAKRWRLDRRRTLANLGAIADDDARALAVLLRAAASDPAYAAGGALGQAAARIGRELGEPEQANSAPCSPETLAVVTDSLRRHLPCELIYRSLADEEPTRRLMRPYGLFELAGSTYLVGLRERGGTEPAVRTLNLGRVDSANLRPDLPGYSVPDGFSVEDYRLLPFEIGDERPYRASFRVPREAFASFARAVRRRGELSRKRGGSADYLVHVRDTSVAAAWAVEVGAIPLAPRPLVSAWTGLLEEVDAHE